MSRLLAAALPALLLGLAACGDGLSADDDPTLDAGATAPDAPVATVPVEIHTGEREVLFHDRDGRLIARVEAEGGVARAQVPAGSSATVGHRVVQASAFAVISFYRYETATSLAAGDVIDLAPAPPAEADLPAVTVTLPPAPEGTTAIVARTCRGSIPVEGATVQLDRRGCGTRTGALLLAGAPAPTHALALGDLGAAPALDLREASWQLLVRRAVTLRPDTGRGRVWALGASARPDTGARVVTPLAPASSPAEVALVAAGATAIVDARLERELPGERSESLTIAWPVAGDAPLTIDADAGPRYPEITAQRTAARALALGGDFAPRRADTRVEAFVDGGFNRTSWVVHLRGTDTAITLPTEGVPGGTITLVTLGQVGTLGEATWARDLTVRF